MLPSIKHPVSENDNRGTILPTQQLEGIRCHVTTPALLLTLHRGHVLNPYLPDECPHQKLLVKPSHLESSPAKSNSKRSTRPPRGECLSNMSAELRVRAALELEPHTKVYDT